MFCFALHGTTQQIIALTPHQMRSKSCASRCLALEMLRQRSTTMPLHAVNCQFFLTNEKFPFALIRIAQSMNGLNKTKRVWDSVTVSMMTKAFCDCAEKKVAFRVGIVLAAGEKGIYLGPFLRTHTFELAPKPTKKSIPHSLWKRSILYKRGKIETFCQCCQRLSPVNKREKSAFSALRN